MISIPGYRLIEPIASGASATVFRAVQEGLGREVAVKVLSPGLFDASETRTRFLRETRIQATLSHPNLLALFDAGFVKTQPYLIVELVTGGTLRDLLSRSPIRNLKRVVQIGLEIASGLRHAHDNGIVHRDLKPANVLFTDDGITKIADFGLAKGQSNEQFAQTAEGVILGTPGYVAPEFIRGKSGGPPADIYALGVVLYEMAMGHRLFTGDTLGSVLKKQVELKPAELATLTAGMQPRLTTLVLACLQPKPAARPTAAEAEKALSALLKMAGSSRAMTPAVALETGRRKTGGGGADTTRLSVSRRRGGGSRQRSATAPTVVSSRPMTGTGRSGKPMVLVAVVLSLLALTGMAFIAMRQPDTLAATPESSHGENRVSESTFATATLERVRISAGNDRARIWFGDPLAAPVSLEYSSQDGKEEQSAVIPAGSTSMDVPGLRPGITYAVSLGLEGQKTSLSSTVLRAGRAAGSLLLEGTERTLRGLALEGRDKQFVIAWARRLPDRGSEVCVRRSPDGGRSWFPEEIMGERREIVDGVHLLELPDGLLLSWYQGGLASGDACFRFRTWAGDWGPVARVSCRRPGAGVASLGAGRVGVGTSHPLRGASLIRWREFRYHEGTMGPPTDVGQVPFQELTWTGATWAAGRAAVYLAPASSRSEPGLTVYQSLSDRPEAGPWPRFRPLLPPQGNTLLASVSTDSDRIYLGISRAEKMGDFLEILAQWQIKLLVSRDGGLTFLEAPVPERPGFSAAFSKVSGDAGKLYHLAIHWIVDRPQDSQAWISTSSGGPAFKLSRKVPVASTGHVGIRLCVRGSEAVLAEQTAVEGVVVRSLPR